MRNFVAVSVCAHVGLKNLGTLGSRPLGRVVDDPIYRHTLPCGSPCQIWLLCRSNRMGVSRGFQTFGRRWDRCPLRMGHIWPLTPRPSPHCQIWSLWPKPYGLYRSNGWCITKEIIHRSLTLRVPPFKVTQGHWNRHGSICHLWLPTGVPY